MEYCNNKKACFTKLKSESALNLQKYGLSNKICSKPHFVNYTSNDVCIKCSYGFCGLLLTYLVTKDKEYNEMCMCLCITVTKQKMCYLNNIGLTESHGNT